MDNFVSGCPWQSVVIDFGDGSPPNFSYAGKNGWPYRSISGKVLIDRGEVKKKICRCSYTRMGRAATAKRSANYWSRTRRSSLAAIFCAGHVKVPALYR